MKSFYVAEGRLVERPVTARGQLAESPSHAPVALVTHRQPVSSTAHKNVGSAARIAIYDGAGSAPRIEEVVAGSSADLIDELATRVYEYARQYGGRVPFSAVREISENFIHAEFREPVVSILDCGNTIRFSDQGPGFSDPALALEPGYTTASREMKRFIRGVGSGLPIAKESLSFAGGSLSIDCNLERGAVVTLSIPSPDEASSSPMGNRSHGVARPLEAQPRPSGESRAVQPELLATGDLPARGPAQAQWRLTNRQKQVLALVMDSGSAGPSIVAKELSVGLSTAHRDLARLESLGLIVADDTGKREITDQGTTYLSDLLNGLF